MKINVIDLENKEVRKIDLPTQFNEEIRQDLIKRDFLAIRANTRQGYGASPEAGKKSSNTMSRRRRDYKTSYGIGISRVPRKILSGKGTRWNWVGAFAPGTVGGRRAHPPKAEKIWSIKINNKEREKALRSALSAVMNKEIVNKRGHLIPENYPFVITNDFEKLKKTKEVKDVLKKIGFEKELEKAIKKKTRAGKGKLRGRRYREKKSLLLVVGVECSLLKSAKNINGVDVAIANKLNTELLAPGANIGRATLFSENAIEMIRGKNDR